MNTDALLIVAGMIAATGFAGLAAIVWFSRRDERAMVRDLEDIRKS